MKKNYLLLSMLCISTILFAQKEKKSFNLSEIKEYKNHLELDVKRVFQDLSSATIIYKRISKKQIENKPNTLKLFRFMGRIDNELNFDRGDSQNVINSTFRDTDVYTSLSFGIEKQIQFKKMVHYHGIDIRGSAGLEYRTRKSTNNIGTYVYRNNESIYSIALIPFFGVKYYFNNRISIGAETGVSFGYSYGIEKVQNDNSVFMNGEVTIESGEPNINTTHQISTIFSNLRLLTIGYVF